MHRAGLSIKTSRVGQGSAFYLIRVKSPWQGRSSSHMSMLYQPTLRYPLYTEERGSDESESSLTASLH